MLGYEGYIKVSDSWALGTGGSIPNTNNRLDSNSGYGGTLSGPKMGVGLPHNYDWSSWDGSIDFELTEDLFNTLKQWILTDRGLSEKDILISSRYSNRQHFTEAVWNSISLTASEGSLVTGSVGFVAMDRAEYVYGTDTANKNGNTDTSLLNLTTIPYWKTKVGNFNFIDWSIDFTQDVVKFYTCNNKTQPQAPKYFGVGAMSVVLTGSCILGTEFVNLGSLDLKIGSGIFSLSDLEIQTQGDDLKTGNNLVPISINMAVYGVG